MSPITVTDADLDMIASSPPSLSPKKRLSSSIHDKDSSVESLFKKQSIDVDGEMTANLVSSMREFSFPDVVESSTSFHDDQDLSMDDPEITTNTDRATVAPQQNIMKPKAKAEKMGEKNLSALPPDPLVDIVFGVEEKEQEGDSAASSYTGNEALRKLVTDEMIRKFDRFSTSRRLRLSTKLIQRLVTDNDNLRFVKAIPTVHTSPSKQTSTTDEVKVIWRNLTGKEAVLEVVRYVEKEIAKRSVQVPRPFVCATSFEERIQLLSKLGTKDIENAMEHIYLPPFRTKTDNPTPMDCCGISTCEAESVPCVAPHNPTVLDPFGRVSHSDLHVEAGWDSGAEHDSFSFDDLDLDLDLEHLERHMSGLVLSAHTEREPDSVNGLSNTGVCSAVLGDSKESCDTKHLTGAEQSLIYDFDDDDVMIDQFQPLPLTTLIEPSQSVGSAIGRLLDRDDFPLIHDDHDSVVSTLCPELSSSTFNGDA